MIRKTIYLVVLLALIVLLVACGPNTAIESGSGVYTTPPTSAASQTSGSVPSTTPASTDSVASASIPTAIPTTGASETRPPQVPTKMVQKITGVIPSKIPTNPSVNSAWDGYMCEAGGFIYYVSDDGKDKDRPYNIVQMKPDGSGETAVTGGHRLIHSMTADDINLYYISDDAIYALPVNGGVEKQLLTLQGEFFCLQAAGGKLYWEQCIDRDSKNNAILIMCMNPDGTDARQVLSLPMPTGYSGIPFLATSNGLYYSYHGEQFKDFILYHTDLQGQNRVQLNNEKIRRVDNLFYDKNHFYYVGGHYDEDHLSLNRLDADGNRIKIIDFDGYFVEDEICHYYGVSGNMFYYTNYDFNKNTIIYDLRSYDINNGTDTLIGEIKMDMDALHWNKSVLQSVRGKTIDVQSSTGFYILGNDLYYSFWTIP